MRASALYAAEREEMKRASQAKQTSTEVRLTRSGYRDASRRQPGGEDPEGDNEEWADRQDAQSVLCGRSTGRGLVNLRFVDHQSAHTLLPSLIPCVLLRQSAEATACRGIRSAGSGQ